jgi:hypothetical protein
MAAGLIESAGTDEPAVVRPSLFSLDIRHKIITFPYLVNFR